MNAPSEDLGARLLELARSVLDHAREKGWMIATVESCTGGLIAHTLTEIPGSSAAYHSGWVVYSNQAKTDQLGVPQNMLEEHGAVSGPVAKMLAHNARTRAQVDLAVSTTGIAGPSGGTAEKPVGLMWCGVADREGSHAEKTLVEGRDRHQTKKAFAVFALERLQVQLEGL